MITAIFYDIENLIGGYGDQQAIENISLKEIFYEIEKSKFIGKIAIQKAYADWSNFRLNKMKGDIVDLGIEPIQMFGFGKGNRKNASDIQLVIDVMETLFLKENIEQYIIVSGDGAFSALAKRVRSYSKNVIGVAYKKTTNNIFKVACDDFIFVEEPIVEVQKKSIELKDPVLKGLSKYFEKREAGNSRNSVRESVLALFDDIQKVPEAKSLFREEGMNISIVKQALDHFLIGFETKSSGFVKFVDFLRYFTSFTGLKLLLKAPSEYRIAYRNVSIAGFKDVGYLDEREIHSIQNYKDIIGNTQPFLRYKSIQNFKENAEKLFDFGRETPTKSYKDLISYFEKENDIQYVKYFIISSISLNILEKVGLGDNLEENQLMVMDMPISEVENRVKTISEEKVRDYLGDVKNDILLDIFENGVI
jgi:uncharacterized LabA/DUF88 family protein